MLGTHIAHPPICSPIPCTTCANQARAAHWWNKVGPRFAASVLLSQVALQALASEQSLVVREWPVREGTHVMRCSTTARAE